MRNRIFISIIDDKGSRQYNLHKIAKKLLFYGLLFLLIVLFAGFFLMNFLMERVRGISEVKEGMLENYRHTYDQNQELRAQISAKSLELIEVNKKVEDLEEIIDYSKNKDTPIAREPITKALSQSDQDFLLQIIPNGHPVESYQKISSVKNRLHPLKERYGIDGGMDYVIPSGTPVYATADGIVELVRSKSSLKGYGRYIKLTHAYGFSSMVGHLSSTLVKKGDFVKKGQMIGYSGRSGSSDGEKLYYEVRFLGGYQDALAFSLWGKKNFESIFELHGVNWNGLLWALDNLRWLQTYRP